MTWNDKIDRKLRHSIIATSCLELWLQTDGFPHRWILNVRPVLKQITYNATYSTLRLPHKGQLYSVIKNVAAHAC